MPISSVNNKGHKYFPYVPAPKPILLDYSDVLTTKTNFLGYVINDKLTWTSHIELTVKKLTSRLQILCILKSTLSKRDLLTAYYAYFQSIIDYCYRLVSSFTTKDKKNIKSMVHRAHNIICGHNCTGNGMNSKYLPDFENRCAILATKLFTKIITNPSHIVFSIYCTGKVNSF